MGIERLAKIKNHGVFREFAWPKDLTDFGRFNLVFGWNGTGKTTLSRLLHCIEARKNATLGEVTFCIDGAVIKGSQLAGNTDLPAVRVFNRAFVEASVLADKQSTISPIFFLGERSVASRKEVVALNKKLSKGENELAAAKESQTTTKRDLDQFLITSARTIKEQLGNDYLSYNKATFRSRCDLVLQGKAEAKKLAEDKKAELRQRKDSTARPEINFKPPTLPELTKMSTAIEDVIDDSSLRDVFREFAGNPEVAEWVRQGVGLHLGDRGSSSCQFCGQSLPEGRIEQLQGHFGNEYEALVARIDAQLTSLNKARALMAGSLPPKEAFYENLAKSYESQRSSLADEIEAIDKYLAALDTVLQDKKRSPFDKRKSNDYIGKCVKPNVTKSRRAVKKIDSLVAAHNEQTTSLEKVKQDARRALEEGFIAESIAAYEEKRRAADDSAKTLDELRSAQANIRSQIGSLEQEIVEHRTPAQELNQELKSYLGHSELKFEVSETGYSITRNDKRADDLSEGEKSAIAFLYFLKSLQDKSFEKSKGVVVIDDPVSSLDNSAIFCAFGYMKERTRDVGQLFVLTHNAPFFRQVRNWFNHLPKQRSADKNARPGRFFMIQSTKGAEGRSSILKWLDPLLHEFESDYQYLFKVVHTAAKRGQEAASLEEFYGLPNVARRLLEAFMAFRFPGEAGQLHNQLKKSDFDDAKKTRVLRFVNTYSHEPTIGEPDHDLSVLGETPQVLVELLQLIEHEDKRHYAEMLNLVQERSGN